MSPRSHLRRASLRDPKPSTPTTRSSTPSGGCSTAASRPCRSSTVASRFAGIFGEREFMSALFPGYLDQLKGAAFLRRSLDETLEKRDACRTRARRAAHEHASTSTSAPTTPTPSSPRSSSTTAS